MNINVHKRTGIIFSLNQQTLLIVLVSC